MTEYADIYITLRNGDIPESIYNLVNNCNKELTIIKSEIGKEHKLFTESSTGLVVFSTNIMIGWIFKNFELLTIPVQGMSLGNNFIEVCSRTFDAINKAEMTESTRNWFNEKKSSFFDYVKSSIQPKSGCYIATMTYGNYNHPQVIHLRKFRDNNLQKTFLGRLLIKAYYAISPSIVTLFKNNKLVIKVTRVFLDLFIDEIKRKESK
jgi:hypothetical protein